MAAAASLKNFTVPNTSDTGLLMPKLKFRFRAFFDNFGARGTAVTELTKQLVSFARPQVQMEAINIPVYNSMVYIAGRPLWQASQVVVRDDAGGQVTRVIGEQLQKQFDFMEQASASSAVDYKFQARIQMLDGANGNTEPTVLEEWRLVGCFLTDVNYNDVSYADNEIVTITMSIRYDNAIQVSDGGNTAGPGVGTERVTVFTPDGAITG
jgi:hypothetical protein